MHSSGSNRNRNKRVALLIANDRYANPDNKLVDSVKNAHELKKRLQRAGFNVTSVENVPEKLMKKAVQDFTESISDGSLVLFYFAGQVCHSDNKNYLIPVEDEKIKSFADVPNFSLDFSGVVDRFNTANKSFVNVFILDCPKPYKPHGIENPIGTLEGPGLVDMKVPHGTFIQFACNFNQTIPKSADKNVQGLFAKHLLKMIAEPNTHIVHLFERIRNAVVKESNNKQYPIAIANLRDFDHVVINQVQIQQLAKIPLGAVWTIHGVTIAGGMGKGSNRSRLNTPRGFRVTSKQSAIIADTMNHRIVECNLITMQGKLLVGNGVAGFLDGHLHLPMDVYFDSNAQTYIVSDGINREVRQYAVGSSSEIRVFAENLRAYGITVDNNGNVYVCDSERHEVRRYGPGCDDYGTLVAGGNGQGNRLHQLNYPTYVFVAANRSVYISDSHNNRVVRWDDGTNKGVVVAGGHGTSRNLDQLFYPTGLVVDELGTIYVADYWNHRIMRWYKNATVGEIILGNRYRAGDQSDHLNGPEGLAFDQYGNLYVADSNNHRIQRFNIRKFEQSLCSDP